MYGQRKRVYDKKQEKEKASRGGDIGEKEQLSMREVLMKNESVSEES